MPADCLTDHCKGKEVENTSRGIETLIEDEEDASATNNELRGIDKGRESGGRVRLLILLKGLSSSVNFLLIL